MHWQLVAALGWLRERGLQGAAMAVADRGATADALTLARIVLGCSRYELETAGYAAWRMRVHCESPRPSCTCYSCRIQRLMFDPRNP
jgi:hypothetical protein